MRYNRCYHYIVILLAIAATPASPQGVGWWTTFGTVGEVGPPCTFGIGALPSITNDGYDGQIPLDIHGCQGAFLLLYRDQNSPGWATGPTGFFGGDDEAPIPWGGSKTWWDIYLWAQGYTHSSQTIRVWVERAAHAEVLAGALLVLDYVPESLGWTGPTEYWLDLSVRNYLYLPIATVTDPLQGTRMHVTVYAIPEPSCLAVIGLGLVAIGPIVRGKRN